MNVNVEGAIDGAGFESSNSAHSGHDPRAVPGDGSGRGASSLDRFLGMLSADNTKKV